MKTRSIICVLFALAFSSLTVMGQDKAAREKAAANLLNMMDMETMMADAMETTLDTQMGQFAKMGMSPEGVKELKEAMLSFMLDVMNWDELAPEFIKIYSENFTEKELNDITAFYQTPTGKKMMKLTPKLMSEGMVMGQKKVEARQAELQNLITPIIQKHMSPQ